MNFCTLFDSYYLDKGIALYESLEKVTKDFTLYIFCFDDRSFDILKQLDYPHAVIIHQRVFEDKELLRLKKERSKAEYCWTCTSVIIEYVLDHYPVENCTYLDADLYFYFNPKVLFDEIKKVHADVVIVEHRFKNDYYGKKLERRNGKYCVQFNYFNQTKNSRYILNWWKEKCFEWCYDIPDPTRMGDQKYLDSWTRQFEKVYELQHLGGGVAPWNLERYHFVEVSQNGVWMQEGQGDIFPLVFYHFQNIRYMPGRRVNIKSQTKDKNLKYRIYIPYLREIERIRKMLITQFGLDFIPSRLSRSSNPFVRFFQRHCASFKIRNVSDIINLDRMDNYLQ